MDTLIGVVPDDWMVCRLDACCSVQPGPSGSLLKKSQHVIGGIPVVRASNVAAAGIRPVPSATVTLETAERLRRYRLQPRDIVLVRIGATTRHALATEQHDGWVLGGSCLRIRAERGISSDYLACYLAHPAVQEWLVEHTRGSVLATIDADTVGSVPLALPPAAVQRGVIEVVGFLNAKVEAHENVIQTTQALRELLLPRLLTGDLTLVVPG